MVAAASRLLRRRSGVASCLVLLLAVTGVVYYAVAADGFRSHDARLHDGGIWVTNGVDGFTGRVNKPIGQLDTALFAELDADLDVVQDGAAVVAVNRSGGLIAPIDPAAAAHPEGEQAQVPGAAAVELAGGTLGVSDPATGAVWAQRIDQVSVPMISGLDQQSPPITKVGGQASSAVTVAGEVLVVSGAKDTVTRIRPEGTSFAKPETQDLAAAAGGAVTVTAVGDTAVVLDAETGVLQVLGGATAEVPSGSVLQHPGPDTDAVLVTSPEALLEVDLVTGATSTLAEGGGRPARPVRLGACRYAAWSGGTGAVATRCGADEPVVARLEIATSDLVFRVNRREILLNDRATGAVWDIDSQVPTQLDSWDAFKREVTETDDDEESDKEDRGDRRPPQAKPDAFGARPGRTTVLHPLDNDSAPAGRILAIRSVDKITGNASAVTISPDGQTVQIRLPADASGTTTFEYTIDDGRSGVSAQAMVTVTVRNESVNEAPHLRDGFRPRQWTVPAGGVLDVPVLPDWRDSADGDPLSVVSAEAVGGEGSGAVARTTASGRVRFNAPAEPGPAEVEYAVGDGRGEPVTETLSFNVQGPKDRNAVPGLAEPDIVSGEVGRPITIRPLDNDLPGSDPLTPDAQLTLAGKLPSPGGASVETDLVDGSLTLTASAARTYFLDYDAAYGNAAFARGRIRVDVRPPQRPRPDPVAMPDAVTLHGQASTLVDVLANDIDPAGGMLVVQGAVPEREGQLDVAVVEGRWLRISAQQGEVLPNPQQVSYTISNGSATAVGEVTVSQRPAPEDDSPVTEVDRVTVRAGSTAAVPVLDNDFSPSGDSLTLVSDVSGEPVAGQLTVQVSGDEELPTGQAFVVGRFVRYVAPTDLEDSQRYTVRYLASNPAGRTSPGRIEITVVPRDEPNQPPEPPVLEGRAVSGDTIRLKLPGSGIDPDGDAVTLTGIGSSPRLGRVVALGANSIRYQAYPTSSGTDEFTYTVTDGFGGEATGTARVAVAEPGTPQPPLAVGDTMTVEPGRTAQVDVLANDLVAAGDRVRIELLDPPRGVSLASDTGPVVIEAPRRADGRTVEVVYRLSNGIDSSQGTVTLRTATPYNNPPVVFDAFGTTEDGDTVTVDVLESAYDPDGEAGSLRVTDVFAPPGAEFSVAGGEVTVARGPEPTVVPFRVEDADGAASTASIYVPAADAGAPYVRPGALIRVEAGETVGEALADHVVSPSGSEVIFPLKDRIWSSPAGRVDAEITGDGSFDVAAADGYEGPAAVTFEVTTGTDVDDPEGVRAVLTVPVQVGEDKPILRCPTDAVEVVQGESVSLDVAALCHAWTPELDGADPDLVFTSDWETSVPGLSIVRPEGPVIDLAADAGAQAGAEAVLLLRTGGSDPGRVTVRVVEAPPPSLAPIRVADMQAGESRDIDLAPYLRPGVSDPVPTLVSAEQITGLDVTITPRGSSGVTISTGSAVDGRAEFRVVMSDVADGGPERRVEGRISLEVLDRPDTPTAPVPGRTVRSEEVALQWRAPDANGSPISGYEVRGSHGEVTRCGSTACDIRGLTNGQAYTFEVRAQNAIGWSDWSPRSAPATPDAIPGVVGDITMVSRGDRTLTLSWDPPTTRTSAIESYHVSWPGGTRKVGQPRITVNGLDNNVEYTFTVQAENALAIGPQRTSPPFQSIGTPGTPAAPAIDHQQSGGDQGVVGLSWPAVNPNGPTPVLYTVLRNGDPLPACTGITATSCQNSGVTYDGTTYTYRVQATNDGGSGPSATGPGASWSAVGEPASWGDWSLEATGTDQQARAAFAVPSSRGAQSRVRIFVNGSVVREFQGTGQRTETFTVPNNTTPHQVRLEVCNESNACRQSSTRSVQTWGPLADRHIVTIRAERGAGSDGRLTRVRWVVTADGNGRSANLRVRGTRGERDQSFTVPGPGTSTHTTAWVDHGHSYTETVEVTLSDTGRGSRSRTATAPATADPPPPEVGVSRGARCQDNDPSLPDCNNGAPGNTDCLN
ncbi:Ig-like domain-containing protein, partial [Nocardioides sp.]|uniref:Ig-like domain-containing protein n=1 Tax=Nocardioides sp. TaxID=35761 RepID=UPI002736B19D